jgi:hypothetical protein
MGLMSTKRVQQVVLKIPLKVLRTKTAPPDVAALMKLVNSTPPEAAPEKFPFVHIARGVFQDLVEMGKERGCPGKPSTNTFSQWREAMRNMPASDPEAERRVAQKDPLFWAGINALVGLEPSIRQCLVCKNFFWVKRRDKKTCNTRCGRTWRQRLYRERYQGTYKQQRILKADSNPPEPKQKGIKKEKREPEPITPVKIRAHRRAPRLPGSSAKNKQ